ncbi:hypothetical protein [Pseudoteredinibacter isoporae]|uniref:hypothetical protein n=1 Tax=Pseudoteredinibacter isoporae TaxID=570281 RepID=UPI003103563A
MQSFLRAWAEETYRVCWSLFKVMLPVVVVVKVLDNWGFNDVLAEFLAPLMNAVGLPESMSLVWAATMLSNIYAGMLVYVQLGESLSQAQISILGALMLTAHGLPVEVAIARQAGVSVMFSLVLRIAGALGFAWLLKQMYAFWPADQAAELLWQPEIQVATSWWAWVQEQVVSFVVIFAIVALLLAVLRLLRILGVEALMAWCLSPVLRFLGIARSAMTITITGITLGMAFGGGILIDEARQGRVEPKDVFSAIMMLSLLHSLVEDTLLVLLLGADFNAVFWGRLVFSLVLVAVLTRLFNHRSIARLCYRDVRVSDAR